MTRAGKALMLTMLAVLIAGAVVIVVMRRDGDKGRALAGFTAQHNYCTLAATFDELSAGAGLAVPPPPGSDPGADAARLVLAGMGADVDEMEKVAPAGIRADVNTVVEAIRKAGGGDPAAMRSAEAAAARQRMTEFGQAMCGPEGVGSGDG